MRQMAEKCSQRMNNRLNEGERVVVKDTRTWKSVFELEDLQFIRCACFCNPPGSQSQFVAFGISVPCGGGGLVRLVNISTGRTELSVCSNEEPLTLTSSSSGDHSIAFIANRSLHTLQWNVSE